MYNIRRGANDEAQLYLHDVQGLLAIRGRSNNNNNNNNE